MNICFHELKSHRKSWFIWSLSLMAFAFLMFTEFDAYFDNPELNAVLEAFPPVLLEAFGMYGANLTTVIGFVSITSLYFTLSLAIYSVLLGHQLIAKEEKDKTGEFLYAMPKARSVILFQKMLAGILLNIALTLVVCASIFFFSRNYQPDSTFDTFVLHMALSMMIIQFLYLVIGMSLAATKIRHQRSVWIAVSKVVIAYFISVAIPLSDVLDPLKYITPFKFFEARDLISRPGLDPLFIVLTLIFVVISFTALWFQYLKKDFHL